MHHCLQLDILCHKNSHKSCTTLNSYRTLGMLLVSVHANSNRCWHTRVRSRLRLFGRKYLIEVRSAQQKGRLLEIAEVI
jgi:hypothetical protein